jgi:hypothetical protein
MEKLDLKKLWDVCNTLSNKMDELSEQDTWVNFLGNRSSYCGMSFEGFLDYYSFNIVKDGVIVYNNDGVPYEDYTNDDFSYVPICLLSFSDEEIKNWMEEEIAKQLKEKEVEKLQQKDYLKNQIKRLQNQLDKL